jgi:predicted O-methyltransferase YrrM
MINEFLTKIELPFVGNDYKSGDFLKKEFEVYFALADIINPDSILEIGIYKGYSACSMMSGSRKLKRYMGLDSEVYIPKSNEMAHSYISEFITKYSEQFPNLKNIEYIIYSFDTMKNDINKLLSNIKFSWIHIDGAHKKDEAIKDMIQFWPLVQYDGIMTVHDYEETHEGVKEAVDEVINKNLLEPNFRCNLFIKSGHNFMVFRK